MLSIANQELHAHMFDRSGVVHSRPYHIHQSPRVLLCMLGMLAFSNPEHIGCDPTLVYPSPRSSQLISPGTIQVGPMIYTIIRQLFFNFLLCGQGTSGWHVWRDGEDYVIKDLWTHASRVNQEEDILNKIHGMKGVPQLVAAWTVKIAGSDDRTDTRRSSFPSLSGIRVHRRLAMQPVGVPLSDFKTIRELLSIIIDVLDSKSEQPHYLPT